MRAVLGVAVALGLLASPALADPRPPNSALATLAQSVTSAHFIVHYTSDSSSPNAISSSDASTLASNAEAAYAEEVGKLGFPPPMDDGDGRTDVYVWNVSASEYGTAYPDSTADQTSGWIDITPSQATNSTLIMHELFHVIQFGIYAHEAPWLLESTAVGLTHYVLGDLGTTRPAYFNHPWAPLDCPGTSCGVDPVYGQWPFDYYLMEPFAPGGAPGLIKEIFQQAAALGASDHASHAFQAIDQALAAHGGSLASAFAAFTVRNMAGQYELNSLSSNQPSADRTITLGAHSQTLAPVTLSVDHLAARYLVFQGAAAPCGRATLRLSVAVPAGVAATPAVDVGGLEGSSYPLRLSGGTAALELGTSPAWTMCEPVMLDLPNASTAADGQSFTVSGSLIVPPTISARLPRTVSLSRQHRLLRFPVSATDPGTLTVTLAGPPRVSVRFVLRAGTNTITLRLPRRMRPGRRQLTLSAVSPTGQAGNTITARPTIKR